MPLLLGGQVYLELANAVERAPRSGQQATVQASLHFQRTSAFAIAAGSRFALRDRRGRRDRLLGVAHLLSSGSISTGDAAHKHRCRAQGGVECGGEITDYLAVGARGMYRAITAATCSGVGRLFRKF